MQKLIEENVQVIIIHWCFHPPFFSQNSPAYFPKHARIFKDLQILFEGNNRFICLNRYKLQCLDLLGVENKV